MRSTTSLSFMQKYKEHVARCIKVFWVTICYCFLFLTFPVFAQASPAQKCLDAIKQASQATGVPENVLLAIAKTETGRTRNGEVQPWPWAMNIRGNGVWLDSETALLERALEQISLGETRFDVGCFQINYHWHSKGFESLDAMIAPNSNALYAAKFLKSLYAEFKDWRKAVGAYHSRNEKFARIYQAKFDAHYDDASATRLALIPENSTRSSARQNSFPLLQMTSQRAVLGSLVPKSMR